MMMAQLKTLGGDKLSWVVIRRSGFSGMSLLSERKITSICQYYQLIDEAFVIEITLNCVLIFIPKKMYYLFLQLCFLFFYND